MTPLGTLLQALRPYPVNIAAEMVGVTPKTVRRWERGETAPSDEMLSRLLMVYRTSAEEALQVWGLR